MKIIEIMERAGINETGRAIIYIKEALDELSVSSETHTETTRIDIVSGQRFYIVPNHANKILDMTAGFLFGLGFGMIIGHYLI